MPPASHTGDEYSYIISGRVRCESNGKVQEMAAGDASFIPAGEMHKSMNDSGEDATLVWMLIEKGLKMISAERRGRKAAAFF